MIPKVYETTLNKSRSDKEDDEKNELKDIFIQYLDKHKGNMKSNGILYHEKIGDFLGKEGTISDQMVTLNGCFIEKDVRIEISLIINSFKPKKQKNLKIMNRVLLVKNKVFSK